MDNIQGKDVLVVDDSHGMLEVLKLALEQAGTNVHTATNGMEGLRKFFSHTPDLIILDLMMPNMDGWEVCQQIRQVSDVPIIMLTALSDDTQIVQGLKCGADEYITKPINISVFLSRVQAVLRRAYHYKNRDLPALYADGHLTIDLKTNQVFVRNVLLKLTATERKLLFYLYQHPDQTLTFDQILANVWGKDYKNTPQYVHVYISNLRKKIEPNPRQPIYFVTEHGVGYRFEKQTT